MEAAQSVDVVFHGKLLSVTDAPRSGQYDIPSKVFSFKVVRTFKGEVERTVEVSTADNSAACGRSYGDAGSEWLIYARAEPGGTLHDNLCSRTTSIDQAAADIAELEANAAILDDDPPRPTYDDPGPADPDPAPILPEDEGSDDDGDAKPADPKPTSKPQRCAVSEPNFAAGGVAGLLGFGLALAYIRRRR